MKNTEVNFYNDKYAYNEVLCEKQDLIDVINSNGMSRTSENWRERIY